jgi:hypothetical protein
MPYPEGHFYAPTPNVEELSERADEIWFPGPQEILGIDFNRASHEHILDSWFPRYLADYDYPDELPEHLLEQQGGAPRYFSNNGQFGLLDSRTLFVFLRALRPARLIEVGSGFSSLLIADVNRRFLDCACHVTCIEPFPRAFLQAELEGIDELLVQKVQDVPVDTFAQLQAGDILFIDSSHVAKTGSDVNYLLFEVLPRLATGVYIHFHDVFLPKEYPRQWVLEDGRAWNEQYLLRALLMYSSAFEVIFGSRNAMVCYPQQLRDKLGLELFGGSFWIRKKA